MWTVKGNQIQMTEGDWGVELPITVIGTTLTASDNIKFTLKDGVGGATILEKTYSSFTNNAFDLELTAADTQKLKPKSYVYNLDWYQNGSFLCNIIGNESFKVVGKA